MSKIDVAKPHTYAPYNRLLPHVVSPLEVIPSELRNQTTGFEILMDGSVGIPKKVVETLVEQHMRLGNFLINRVTSPSSSLIATAPITKIDQPHISDGITILSSPDYYSTRQKESYYGLNHAGPNSQSKEVRKAQLGGQIQETVELLENWTEVEASIRQFDYKEQWQLMAGLFHIMTNELIGIDYYLDVLALKQPTDHALQEHSRIVSSAVFKATTLYYQLLANPLRALQPIDISPLLTISNSLFLFGTLQDATNIDTVRTRREADLTYLTLAAAITFQKEFGYRIPPPKVLIPKLGGYDLGAALRAIGYTGEIVYIINTTKNLQDNGMRDDEFQEIPLNIIETLRDSDVVIFDDTVGKAKHLQIIVGQLAAHQIFPIAVRTMMLGYDSEGKFSRARLVSPQGASGFEADGFLQSYFLAPISRRKEFKRGSGKTPGQIQREAVEFWARRAARQ